MSISAVAPDVRELAAYAERELRLYIYPITTAGWASHEEMSPFVDEALRNISAAPSVTMGRSRQTYSAGLLFLQRALRSPSRTTDADRADLFVVPQCTPFASGSGTRTRRCRVSDHNPIATQSQSS